MKVIALQGIRGGVGTTAIVAGLALAAHEQGARVLLDLPLGMAPVIPCRRLLVVNADANCHVRLHRHPWAADERLLVTQFSSQRALQQGLLDLWLAGGLPLLNLHLHRDEAMAEAMAAKLPVGRYAPTSLVAHELAALATWCLAEVEAPR
ncbi:cellulose synthase operon protein YhjQ/BcsQ [Aeromonas caviae]